MIIEYTDTAKSTKLEGLHFNALLFMRKHNTNIIYELWSIIKENERNHLKMCIKYSKKHTKIENQGLDVKYIQKQLTIL